MKVFKGTDKDLKCHGGFQFELGKTEKDDAAIRCGDHGFHSCDIPLDVWRYFPPVNGNRFFVAEADGKIDRTGADDSKLASSEITLKAEIGLLGLINAQIEYTKKKAESGIAGGRSSNLAGGCSSNLAGGDSSIIVGRTGSKAKGGKNSVIVLTDWKLIYGKSKPVYVKAAIVDGVNIKADTWYKLENGEFVEA